MQRPLRLGWLLWSATFGCGVGKNNRLKSSLGSRGGGQNLIIRFLTRSGSGLVNTNEKMALSRAHDRARAWMVAWRKPYYHLLLRPCTLREWVGAFPTNTPM